MSVVGFIIRRYSAYTLLTTCSVTALACLVDFFEKIRHAPAINYATLQEFLIIPFATRIFGLFPAGIIIGTILLHQELKHQHFYETLMLSGAAPKKLFMLFLTASSIFAVGATISREFLITKIQTLITQPVVPIIIAPISPQKIGVFRTYNLVDNTATITTLLELDPSGHITQENRSLKSQFFPEKKMLRLLKTEHNEEHETPYLNAALEQAKSYRQLYSLATLASYATDTAQSASHATFYRTQFISTLKFLIDATILPAVALTLAGGILFSAYLEYGVLLAPFITGLMLDRALWFSWKLGTILMLFSYGIALFIVFKKRYPRVK